MTVRTLTAGDEAAVEAFLAAHADASMFLRSNLRRAGLDFHGQAYGGTWVAAVADGAVVGVAAHAWNGLVLLQAAGRAGDLAAAAAASSGRAVGGFVGPWAQVVEARAALGLTDRPARLDSREDLFSLDLDALIVPAALADGRVAVRVAGAADHDVLAAWRYAYEVEAIGSPATAETAARARADICRVTDDGHVFVATVDGAPVAMSAFNARLPDMVQIGGVYTPPDARGRGYARAVVAGSLRLARETGATRSILFTGVDNTPARRAYLALGYRVVGDYGLVVFA